MTGLIITVAFIMGIVFGNLVDWLEEWIRDKID